MSLTRRALLRGSAAAGALLLGAPSPGRAGLLSGSLGPAFATARASALFPGTAVVHADLHNHSLLSDGDGDPAKAFASMRDAGLDAAALTDHSTTSWGALSAVDELTDPCFGSTDCRSVAGIDEAAWARTKELADAADAPHSFTALRGFEWSSPFLGHMNVWFSQRWIDPLHTGGVGPEGFGEHLHENVPAVGSQVGPLVDGVLRANPVKGAGMALFYDWLAADADRPGLGGGADALAGFNHPGREQGRFGYFRYDPAIAGRVVSLEIFNRRDDYLFAEFAQDQPSPLVECLNAGWRVGLLGVTDEHGADWGHPDGKGRAGLWVGELTRAGVREALAARRFFATNVRGLRLDASAKGVRMGQSVPHTKGPVAFKVDLDRGGVWAGKPLQVQVLRPDTRYPRVVHVEDFVLGAPGTAPLTFTVPLDVADGDWVVLRIADPAGKNNEQGPAGHPCNNLGVAYASPFWLAPPGA